jgi:hypothetical protein
MTPGTAVEPAASSEVAALDPALQEAIAAQNAALDQSGLTVQTPILKIGQATTKEVRAEEAEQGEFINSATGEALGTKVEFIITNYHLGRFASDKDSGRAFTASGETIPAHWAPLVGEEFVGTPFSEYPDAEEQFKERVNAGDIKWGSGPLVSTTHNYTGLVVIEGEEGAEDDLVPARLSLQRTNVRAAGKIKTLLGSFRNKAWWEKTFVLTTEKHSYTRGDSYLLVPALGRKTTPDEKQAAVELFQASMQGRVSDNAETAEAPGQTVEPDAKGGLGL